MLGLVSGPAQNWWANGGLTETGPPGTHLELGPPSSFLSLFSHKPFNIPCTHLWWKSGGPRDDLGWFGDKDHEDTWQFLGKDSFSLSLESHFLSFQGVLNATLEGGELSFIFIFLYQIFKNQKLSSSSPQKEISRLFLVLEALWDSWTPSHLPSLGPL